MKPYVFKAEARWYAATSVGVRSFDTWREAFDVATGAA